MLLAEIGALLNDKALPLGQDALVHVGEKQRHEGVVPVVPGHTVEAEIARELLDTREVLCDYNRTDQLNGLVQEGHSCLRLFFLSRPLALCLLEEACKEMLELLKEVELARLRGLLESLFVYDLEFDPDHDCPFVEAHICLEEADGVDLFKTGACCAILRLLLNTG